MNTKKILGTAFLTTALACGDNKTPQEAPATVSSSNVASADVPPMGISEFMDRIEAIVNIASVTNGQYNYMYKERLKDLADDLRRQPSQHEFFRMLQAKKYTETDFDKKMYWESVIIDLKLELAQEKSTIAR
jgi:hypothetical protein